MTPADIVAEAIDLTDDGTARPPVLYVHAAHRGPGMYGAMATYFRTEAAGFAGPDGVTEYVRRDVVDAALRRERDALAARVEALRTGIRKAMSTCARRDHGHVECWKDGRDALDADDSAAGKGVG